MSWPEDVSRDRLVDDWYIYQRRGGHRTSTDDLLTAYHAVSRSACSPRSYLDLGCGVGSVLLMVLYALRPGRAQGIEAQGQSLVLARRSLAELPVEDLQVTLTEGDLRDTPLGEGGFELITGSPPYFPVGTGVLPADPQRRACRFEERGGVEEYCAAAASLLAPGGRFHLVHQTDADARVLRAAGESGLHLRARVDVLMRADRSSPFLTVYEFRREAGQVVRESFAVRGRDGLWTEAYRGARHRLGLDRTGGGTTGD